MRWQVTWDLQGKGLMVKIIEPIWVPSSHAKKIPQDPLNLQLCFIIIACFLNMCLHFYPERILKAYNKQ